MSNRLPRNRVIGPLYSLRINENMALIREVMDGIDVTELLDEVNILVY